MSGASTPIAVSRLHFPVSALGPGRRVGIWFQGCSIRCPGCISADTWAFRAGAVTVGDVLAATESWLPAADGITISGGEPFDQVEPLEVLLRELRGRGVADILVFSGYSLEALGEHLRRLSDLIDAIVTDPFEKETPQTLRLRGSDNQRLTFLTPRGRQRFAAFEQPRDEADHYLDIAFDDDGAVWFAGIPQRNDLARLGMLLESEGHRVMTSEDKSCR